MKIQDGQTLLCIGDSITDCGRARPLGEGENGTLGTGYVHFLHALLAFGHPDRRIRVLNTGISGNRVTDLAGRWDSDVLAHEPDWLTVMIGINDVWRQFDKPLIPQVDEETYRVTLDELVSRTPLPPSRVVLMSPFYLETNRSDAMRAMADRYGKAVAAVAEKRGTLFVDIQAAFDNWLAKQPTQRIAGDRVHPNAIGHMAIARTLEAAL